MKYKLSNALEIDYKPLAEYVPEKKRISKSRLLELCSGNVSFNLLQAIKELEFGTITKEHGELYIY